MMQKRFNDLLEMIFAESCGDCYDRMMKEAEYQKVMGDYQKTYLKMQKKLGKHVELLLRLEELLVQREALQEQWIYRWGMRDCMYLLRWLDAVERGEAAPAERGNNAAQRKTLSELLPPIN